MIAPPPPKEEQDRANTTQGAYDAMGAVNRQPWYPQGRGSGWVPRPQGLPKMIAPPPPKEEQDRANTTQGAYNVMGAVNRQPWYPQGRGSGWVPRPQGLLNRPPWGRPNTSPRSVLGSHQATCGRRAQSGNSLRI
jgi:hypothetical protein